MTAAQVARTLIAIGSGKGGVGKSTVSANLAVALARMGKKVGLIDADVYGPSQPTLARQPPTSPSAENDKLIPVEAHGIRFLSLGQLVSPGHALAWRGPMATGALANLIEAEWGDAELLLVDLPPGTGDVQLSLIQRSRPAGAVIVSTPQDLSLIDARRAVDLFNKTSVPVLGIIENMATYTCPHCGEAVASVRDRRRRSRGGGDGRAVPRPTAAVARHPRSIRRRHIRRRWRRPGSRGVRGDRRETVGSASSIDTGKESCHAADPRRGYCRAADQRPHDRGGRRVGPARAPVLRRDEVPAGSRLSRDSGQSRRSPASMCSANSCGASWRRSACRSTSSTSSAVPMPPPKRSSRRSSSAPRRCGCRSA